MSSTEEFINLIITLLIAFATVKIIRRILTISRPKRNPQRQNQRQKLILILDESGSMQGQRLAVIQGVNQFLSQQKENQDLLPYTDFRLVKFHSQVDLGEEKPLQDTRDLTIEDYQPNNMTALYDAIGMTAELYPETNNVIVCIVTDGAENSSQIFTEHYKIQDLIQEKKDNHQWAFIYLSENLESQGESMGIQTSSSLQDGSYNYSVDPGNLGTYLGSQDNSSSVMAYRVFASSAATATNDPS